MRSLAAHNSYGETSIKKMKKSWSKGSNRNITPILSSKLPDLTFFILVGVELSEWGSFVGGVLVGDIGSRWGFLVVNVFLVELFLRW